MDTISTRRSTASSTTRPSPRSWPPGLHHLRAAKPLSGHGPLPHDPAEEQSARPVALQLHHSAAQRTLEWLSTLPNVDPERIGFYGLSYGGKTAVRVPTMLPQYGLSICSGDFNEWVRKNATDSDKYSYVFTPEYEMFEWDMGHVANYAELAHLMTPRPFMVERGHDDGVAPDEWVAWEYAKVRRHYDKLGWGTAPKSNSSTVRTRSTARARSPFCTST